MKIPAYNKGLSLYYYSKGKQFFTVISKYSIIQSISFEQIIIQAVLICRLFLNQVDLVNDN